MESPTHSSVNIINRALNPYRGIITTLTTQDYSTVCKSLQSAIQSLYEHLLFHRHDGQIAEYRVANDEGFWTERLNLREYCHGTPSLSVIMDTCPVMPGRTIEYAAVPHAKANQLLRDHFSGSEYCHLLFHERVKQFILECSKLLNPTHDLELETMDGVLYFKATPHEGFGTLTIISRSQDAVIAADSKNLSKLHAMGYKASFENVGLVH